MKKSSVISFVQDNRIRNIDMEAEGLSPTCTVLQYLRSSPTHRGTKEGCAEGDCGACTVVLAEADVNGKLKYSAVDSCLIFLPMLHGKQLITVENLTAYENGEKILHPVQQSMVDCNGSQCGYCTPGIIMSLFSLYKNDANPSHDNITDSLTGNLCRCTGYRPIIEAAAKACVHNGVDHFDENEGNIIELLSSIQATNSSVHIDTGFQTYARPQQVQEALRLKHSKPEALLVSSATDIALRVTKKREVLREIIDLSALNELKSYSQTGKEIHIGSGVTLEDIRLQTEKTLPALHKMLNVFGSRQIRSMATLGGNIASASPIGDTLPVLIAYKANVHLQNLNGERSVPANDFVTGYRQTRKQVDEIITHFTIPVPDQSIIIDSYKVSKRKDLDISTVSACFRLKLNSGNVEEIILAYGGMAEMTKRAAKAEAFLTGKKWQRENVEEAARIIYSEFSPISDTRSGAEFRRLAARNLLIKFWSEHF